VQPVEHYPDVLLENLKSVAPEGVTDPIVVLLTAGAYNSAYFEHAFLAQQMASNWWKARISSYATTSSTCRTTRGPKRVDVVYRRLR